MKRINRRHAPVAHRFRHLIQPIQQQGKLVFRQPALALRPRRLLLGKQLLRNPFLQRQLFASPGSQIEHGGQRPMGIGFSPRQQRLRQLEQENRFAAGRFTQNKQRTAVFFVNVENRRLRRDWLVAGLQQTRVKAAYRLTVVPFVQR